MRARARRISRLPDPKAAEGGSARGARQASALPYRGGKAGRLLEVLLVTSRETRRWIVPKGKVDPGMTPPQAAAQEALEEAGVIGEIGAEPIGQFVYLKRFADLSSEWIEVDLFALSVVAELGEWKEQHQRQRRWFAPAAAAKAVDEPELGELIVRFGRGLGPRPLA